MTNQRVVVAKHRKKTKHEKLNKENITSCESQ